MAGDTLVIIVVGIGAVYLIYALILNISRRELPGKTSPAKKISLIVSAKNEERDLPRLLNSLTQLNYPPENLEIILIDHRSTDNTGKLMQGFSAASRFQVKILTVEGPPSETSCKSEALIEGISAAAGELLVFTDAEVRFEPDWLLALTGEIWNYDLAGGPVVIEGGDFFQRMQRLDWLFLGAAGAGLAGMNQAQTVFGKNMAVTRQLYEKSGGFTEGKVLTEDLSLVQRCRGKGLIGYTLKKECAVYSLAADNSRQFFRQRIRWIKGAMGEIAFAGWTALAMGFIINLTALYCAFAGAGYFIALMAIKSLGDWMVLHEPAKNLGQPGDQWLIPLYSLYSAVYQIILTALLPLARNLCWR